jgi:hypothetical protein
MISITRRGALLTGAAMAAGCAQSVQEQPREGRIAVPGGEVVWRRFGDGPRTPLLAIHGGPGFPSDYLETLARLETSGLSISGISSAAAVQTVQPIQRFGIFRASSKKCTPSATAWASHACTFSANRGVRALPRTIC